MHLLLDSLLVLAKEYCLVDLMVYQMEPRKEFVLALMMDLLLVYELAYELVSMKDLVMVWYLVQT